MQRSHLIGGSGSGKTVLGQLIAARPYLAMLRRTAWRSLVRGVTGGGAGARMDRDAADATGAPDALAASLLFIDQGSQSRIEAVAFSRDR